MVFASQNSKFSTISTVGLVNSNLASMFACSFPSMPKCAGIHTSVALAFRPRLYTSCEVSRSRSKLGLLFDCLCWIAFVRLPARHRGNLSRLPVDDGRQVSPFQG